jgi:hypothetical protein
MTYKKKQKNIDLVKPAKVVQEFKCKISVLFSILYYCWDLCEKHLPLIQAKFSGYDLNLINTRRGEIPPVRSMPSYQQRSKEVEDITKILKKKKPALIRMQNMLFRYIDNMSHADYKQNVEAAGYNEFVKAEHNNWNMLSEMLNLGYAFIVANETELLASGKMPTTFKTEYNTAKNDYRTPYSNYSQTKQSIKEDREAKIVACNGLYKKVMTMNKDANRATIENPVISSGFTFAAAKRYFDPKGIVVRTIKLAANETKFVKGILMHSVVAVKGKYDVYACAGNVIVCDLASGGMLITTKNEEALPFDVNDITFTNASDEGETTIVVHLLRKT